MSHKFISLVITKYFSCFFSASHVRDILRKSYGDEGPGGLGPSAVLNVPEGKYRDVWCSLRYTPERCLVQFA